MAFLRFLGNLLIFLAIICFITVILIPYGFVLAFVGGLFLVLGRKPPTPTVIVQYVSEDGKPVPQITTPPKPYKPMGDYTWAYTVVALVIIIAAIVELGFPPVHP